jgi:hypothetical protein
VGLEADFRSSLSAGRVFKIKNLSDVDATLLEPASCAAHGPKPPFIVTPWASKCSQNSSSPRRQ